MEFDFRKCAEALPTVESITHRAALKAIKDILIVDAETVVEFITGDGLEDMHAKLMVRFCDLESTELQDFSLVVGDTLEVVRRYHKQELIGGVPTEKFARAAGGFSDGPSLTLIAQKVQTSLNNICPDIADSYLMCQDGHDSYSDPRWNI